ncbi:MAG: hypothetical protein M1308_11940 [Actinobacteria bacterium]|nr:hypothetical protein [Actinomycetota bacterium]
MVIGVVFWISKSVNFGQVNVDTIRGSSNSYTSHIASSSASRVLDFGNRMALECVNGGSNAVHLYLTSTSTGVVATSGIFLASSGGSYTPEFVWPGQVWVITETGTSSVVCQETKR